MGGRIPDRPDPQNACRGLANGVARIARLEPRPKHLVRAVAWELASIRPGVIGFVDLVRGGRNRLRGGGFMVELDDGSDGQVRHFVGVAAAVTLLGPRLTTVLMRTVGGDKRGVPDDRLTARSIEWVHLLRTGRLNAHNVAAWIRTNVCDPAEQ